MKKTYNISLNGQVFCIEEDAFIQLQNYITTLEHHYFAEEDGKEIMADIESRIAELFQTFQQETNKKVISQPEIDKVIEIMGSPDVIIDEDTEYNPSSDPQKHRKLYRDPDQAILGGVAAGLAAYFSISIAWVRILFILSAFLYGITFIVYIILWIVLPQAITSKQKLEMKGEEINISNIEKNIRNTYNEVKKNSTLQQIGKKLVRFFSCIGEIIYKTILMISYFLVTVALIVCTFCFFIVCCGMIFSWHGIPEHYQLLLSYFSAPVPLYFLQVLLFGFLATPLFLLIYYSIIYLFKLPSHKGVLIIAGCIWIFCASLIFVFGCYYALSNSHSYENKTETITIPADTTHKALYIHFNAYDHQKYNLFPTGIEEYYMHYNPTSKDTLFLHPFFTFYPTANATPYLIIRKKSCGITQKKALENVKDLRYNYRIQKDTLYLDDSFTLGSPQMRDNHLRIECYIPEGYRVHFRNPPIFQFLHDNFWDKHLVQHPHRQIFQMQEGKLKRISEQTDSGTIAPQQLK